LCTRFEILRLKAQILKFFFQKKKKKIADRVFGSGSSTEEVYKTMAQPIIEDAMKGINGAIFAYGQTASGKTFTMQGFCSFLFFFCFVDKDGAGVADAPGIVPLSIKQVFERIRECPDQEFLLRVSYLEIYNEKVRDLLAVDDAALQVRQDPKSGTYVAGLLEEVVISEEQVELLLLAGERKRSVGTTMMNHQ
jgi:centromeric protein E